ncbi:protein SRG1-like [Punica granatum]|uniref:Protein SRG1-like n=2 Tax=Punica granatum TaxID=22663 RepID=A0A6P8DBS1_PUNGR|nr:protein SRG1-like [Punica granatum]
MDHASKMATKEGESTDSIYPTIDVSLLSSSENELQKVKSVLSSCGCFQAVGHGIPSEFLDKVRGVAKEFFALPDEEKQKCVRAANEVEGYGDDLIVAEKQVIDCCYRLFLRVFPVDQRRLNLWPENPTDFGEILHEYATKVKSVMDDLSKVMARSLNLDEDSFLSQYGARPIMQVRFNFYPPSPSADVLGVKPHSDRSGITVLLQDEEVEGLQVFKDGAWATVPVIPQALVVNLGDQMQIMSNGIFKSPVHRVLTNPNQLRLSVAMFNEPEQDGEIGPLHCLVDEARPRMYRTVKNYAAFNYECVQKGKVPLEEVRIKS